jgi:hypothetical protein
MPWPGVLGFDPSTRRSKGHPVVAASPRAVAARSNLTAALLTFDQRLPPSVSLPRWSMRPWESAVPPSSAADGFPGSHGPPEERVSGRKVDFWLTSRRPANFRNLAVRGHSHESRRRRAGQPGRDPAQDGGPGRDLGQEGSLSAAEAGIGRGRALGSMRGARPWRPPAS